MIEKLIFNVLAFTLFILLFIRLIRKNDTSYVYLLILQFIGIAINFIELSIGKSFGVVLKTIMYSLSILLPIFVLLIEQYNIIRFSEIVNLLLATIYILIENKEKAEKCLLQLINKYPNSIKGHLMLAKLYGTMEKYELSLEEYEKVLEQDSKNWWLQLKIGELYNKLGRKEIATKTLYSLLKEKPDCYEASMLLGNILYESENYKEAIQVYTNALNYRPADYDLYYNIGMAYTMINDFQKAKEAYEQAAQINSLLYHAKYSLGQLNILYGELDEAERYFMECIDTDEVEAGAYYYLARIAMVRGEIEKAKNYANIAIEKEPSLFEKMLEENIFLPIIDLVNKPEKKAERYKTDKQLSLKELQIDEHLDNTCKLVGKLNNNDIEMIENVRKTQSKDLNREQKERE